MFKSSIALCSVLLTLSACADADTGGGSTEDELRTGAAAGVPTRRMRVESCMDDYGGTAEKIELGTRLVLDVPNGYEMEEAFGVAPGILPDWSAEPGKKGRTLYTFDTGGDEIEKFLRLGRFHFVKPWPGGATVAKSCAFEGVKEHWTRVRAIEWLMGDSDEPAVERERDLGVVSLEGGLLVEAHPFSQSRNLQTRLTHADGDLEPVRTTAMQDDSAGELGSGGGDGTHVFQVEQAGDYRFDLLLFAEGYGNVLNHVRVRFE